MSQEEFLNKLAQIEEQARTTLAELPNTRLIGERMRMVMALARYMRTELMHGRATELVANAPLRPSDNDDQKQASG